MGAVPIGTGEAVTPLQILDAYNAVANGGVLVPPRLVEATVAADGSEHVLAPAARNAGALEPHGRRAAADARAGDRGRHRDRGTDPGVYRRRQDGDGADPERDRPGYSNDSPWSATFVGFAPAQNPALTTFVMLSHPDLIYGGLASAPVFSEIMRYALRHFDIAPSGGQGISSGSSAPRHPVSGPAALALGPGGPARRGRRRGCSPDAVIGETAGVVVTSVTYDHRRRHGRARCTAACPASALDGHDFAAAAARAGAVAFVCERPLGGEAARAVQLVFGPAGARPAMAVAACALCARPGLLAAHGRGDRHQRQDDDDLLPALGARGTTAGRRR